MGDIFFLIVFLPHNRKTWIYVKNYSYREPKGGYWNRKCCWLMLILKGTRQREWDMI